MVASPLLHQSSHRPLIVAWHRLPHKDPHHFSRNRASRLSRILEKYQTNSGKILWGEKHKSLSAEIDRVKKENDNMQNELRPVHLKGEDLNSLQPRELIAIEEALQNGQTNLREKQANISFIR
nr:unnamed protein product [Digitaria exilis]